MLKIKATNSKLLEPLQQVTGIVERRHTLPILSNVLITAGGGHVDFLATDLEVQITARADLDGNAEGSITVGARKLFDILRALPEDVEVALEAKESRMVVRAGKSRFNLQTLAAADFPKMVEAKDASRSLALPQKALKEALRLVQFAMAVQDIRYYLNGVLFSVDKNVLRVVATDGHRLSFASQALEGDHGSVEAILPRKTVIELIKLLGDTDELVAIAMGANQVRFAFSGIEIVSKIVEGKFPDYQKVIPTTHKNRVSLERTALAQSLNRAAILSNEKIRGVRLVFTKGALSIICTNNEQEEAEEGLAIDYDGDPLDIGFNISYLLDVLNHIDAAQVSVTMGDSNSSALIEMPGREDFKYVVMPMRI
ncbi:DNA polymerase III subunit beta [Usitatibacter palustris]|uniref:Beta sliding clamp n=1 Tax=Usitatibacter palustris TaxID=2732487 RepID=A0A6M4H175_9PROT|nr:DNA polymerase III subunit beta [Usitatibacter palustris]QJR13220.1 Beta sliding clamp [Usitatibacter palustris]